MSITSSVYMRWLWWRHTWTFQGAHKPLCDRFHRDVLHMGRLHVCRSCAALYGSLGVALVGAPLYRDYLGTAVGVSVTGLLLSVLLLSSPAHYRHRGRLGRDLLRGLTGALGGVSLVALTTVACPWGIVNLVGLVVAWRVFRQTRNQYATQSDACTGCSECGKEGICSGFQQQAMHLRAYEEAATTWLEQGYRFPE